MGCPSVRMAIGTASAIKGESTFPGRIFKVALDGKVLGVIGRSGRRLKEFSGAHALECPSETEVYAAETPNWRVQKLIIH